MPAADGRPGQRGHGGPGGTGGLAATARKTGRVATSTFGVGEDFDERLLRGMADASGGRFYYIERPEQIPDLLTSELGELLEVVARDACLMLHLPKGVEAAPLNALETAAVTGGIQIHLGDLVSGQQLDVVVALKFPAGHAGDTVAVQFGIVGPDRRPGRCASGSRLELRGRPRPQGSAP